MIINGAKCDNFASTRMVEKMGLPIIEHPLPYRMQGFDANGEWRVTNQVSAVSLWEI